MGLWKCFKKADLGANTGSIEEQFSKNNGQGILEDENIRKAKSSFLCFYSHFSTARGKCFTVDCDKSEALSGSSVLHYVSFFPKYVVPSPVVNSQVYSSKLVFYRLMFILREPKQESASTLVYNFKKNITLKCNTTFNFAKSWVYSICCWIIFVFTFIILKLAFLFKNIYGAVGF